MTKELQVPLDSFVEEILTDLPLLIVRHPKGITYRVLQEEYGESIPRIARAVSLLEEQQLVKVFDALPPYILPKDYTPPTSRPYQDLSDLQRRLFQILVENCQRSGTNVWRIRTNYAQLARLLDCSTGGSRSSLERLVTLGYLSVIEPSQPGKTSALLLAINTSKVQNTVAHNLDS